MTQTLTLAALATLKGKTIQWSSIGYAGNNAPKGIATINNVDMTQRKPIASTNIEGDNLSHSFIECGELWFGDFGRFVNYTIINN